MPGLMEFTVEQGFVQLNIAGDHAMEDTMNYGSCPECGRADGFFNTGTYELIDHWFVCDAHRTRWLFPVQNHFDTAGWCYAPCANYEWNFAIVGEWEETQDDWDRNEELLLEYRPVRPDPEDATNAGAAFNRGSDVPEFTVCDCELCTRHDEQMLELVNQAKR